MNSSTDHMLVILGPTASGKTELAARVAYHLNGEIISADSRQVYREMNIGTGKDYDAYVVDGRPVPVHLIDKVDPGYEYNIFDFQRDFASAWKLIREKGHLPVLCGGSGLYLESILKKYKLPPIPDDRDLENKLLESSDEELKKLLLSLRIPHNTTDLLDRNRLIRAIRIGYASQQPSPGSTPMPDLQFTIYGILLERENLNRRINGRLIRRLKDGMIEEVKSLLDKGYTLEQMKFYGLEYRYIAMFINNEITYAELVSSLSTAICRFAKRQMTWFRKMERSGLEIRWLDGSASITDNSKIVIDSYISGK